MRQKKAHKAKKDQPITFTHILKTRLWNDGKLGKVNLNEVAEEFYFANNPITREKVRNVIGAIKPQLEDYTGYILTVSDGVYELTPFSQKRKIDIENDKRQLAVTSRLRSLRRVYKTLILHKPRGMKYIQTKFELLTSDISKVAPASLQKEAKNDEKMRSTTSPEVLLKLKK